MSTAPREWIRVFLYACVNLLVFPSKRIVPKSLLLIRLDAIGDYILFRNFIEILKNSTEYKTYNITLLGNRAWKDLAEGLDKDLIETFIWVDRKQFNRNLVYRYKTLKKIASRGYEIVIHPTYSREYYFGDSIVKLVAADEKIGYNGDLFNISAEEKKNGDAFYTKLIPSKKGVEFEFYRNKDFFEALLGRKLEIKKPSINCGANEADLKTAEHYAVLFIGASAQHRKWPIESFVEIAVHIMNTYGLDVVICGGPEDKHDGKKLAALIHEKKAGRIIDLTGRTNLMDLCTLIKEAAFMVSNETSAAHMAVAVDVPVVVIYSGSHFGRFTPYPEEMTERYAVVYHPAIEARLHDYQKQSNLYGFVSRLDIADISAGRVKEKLDIMIANRKLMMRP